MQFIDLQPYIQTNTFFEETGLFYSDQQIGNNIVTSLSDPLLDNAQLIIIGCNDMRNCATYDKIDADHTLEIRKELYKMYYWHKNICIADIGNVKIGASVEDTKAALQYVLEQLHQLGKTVLILNGTHDFTNCQYQVYNKLQQLANATIVDIEIDLNEHGKITDDNFLYDLLTTTPNFVSQCNIMGFQSYYTNPKMVSTLDKLHFECNRLGRVKENIESMEPYIRQTHFASFDIKALQASIAPSLVNPSPNGLNGEEACALTSYAGMSDTCSTLGIYGYQSHLDSKNITAKQIAQMAWYFIDGLHYKTHEVEFTNKQLFNEFTVNLEGNPIVFTQSKHTARWWMQLPNKSYVPCCKTDYNKAAYGEIPDRYLREVERKMFQGV